MRNEMRKIMHSAEPKKKTDFSVLNNEYKTSYVFSRKIYFAADLPFWNFEDNQLQEQITCISITYVTDFKR